MAQGFSTGGGGIIKNYPLMLNANNKIVIAEETALPTGLTPSSLVPMTFDAKTALALGIYGNYNDEVGITTSSRNFEATPKTMTITTDRDDIWTLRWMQRYCPSLVPGRDKPVIPGKAAKGFEDGIGIRQTDETGEIVALTDCILSIWFGAPINGMAGGKNMRNLIYGIFSVAAGTPNDTTAYNEDNQYTYTLTAQPQEYDCDIELEDLYISNSITAKDVGAGNTGGLSSFERGILEDENDISKLFAPGYKLYLPKHTGIVKDAC
jgi:hypothetical protein